MAKTDKSPNPIAPEDYAPTDAKPWLDALTMAEEYFRPYHDFCDRVELRFANLKRLAERSGDDREFQMFWANMEVLRPLVYARAPVPIAMPRFRKREELSRRAAEILERTMITDYETDHVHDTLLLARDDLALNSRAVIWCRYSTEDGMQKAPAEHLDRRDFLHEPARKWREVGWVARAIYLTREQGLQRFGEKYLDVQLAEQTTDPGKRDTDDAWRGEQKGKIWEIWSKTRRLVVWVAEGSQEVLDLKEPFLQLDDFFPCPRPAYGTLEPRTLMPIPDVAFYQDQIDEIDLATNRIAALTEALKLRGFYPGGASDLKTAVETAIAKSEETDTAVLIPVSNFAALGVSSMRDAVLWLPVQEVAQVITNLVQVRKQSIDDVYQITGLSDIMRGDTVASETLGAQQIKTQFGSVRIRSKQGEMVRLAHDVTKIKAEIMAENFEAPTFIAMSQVTDLPSAAMVQQEIAKIEAMVQQARRDPRIMQAAAENPQIAQQVLQQAQAQQQQLAATVTIEKVLELFRAQRVRPFVLEIETDSTIQPDENAEKQRRSEFVTAVGGFIQAAGPMVQQMPQTAPFVAEVLKFLASGYRAGREMDDAIDELAEMLKQLPSQETPVDPQKMEDELTAQNDAERVKIERDKTMAEIDLKREENKLRREEITAQQATQLRIAEEATKQKALEKGMPAGYTRDEITEFFGGLVQQIAESQAAQTAALGAAIKQLTQAALTPKRIVRDESGRAQGVEPETIN